MIYNLSCAVVLVLQSSGTEDDGSNCDVVTEVL